MLLFGGAFGVLAVAMWLFCIIDTITTPEGQTRNLPKLAWIFIVIFLLDVGAIAWLVAGRPWGARSPQSVRAGARPSNPDDDDEFLAGLKARADEQRRRARDTKPEEPPTATG